MSNEEQLPPPKPHRQYEVTITVSGDTWKDVQRELLDTADHVSTHGPQCNSVSGGGGSAHTVSVAIDATMTPERFEKELHAYADWLKAREHAPAGALTGPDRWRVPLPVLEGEETEER